MAENILIVDDDDEFRSELRGCLDGYDVLEASDGRQALEMLQRANEIGTVILDIMMPGLSGIDILREIKKIDVNLGIIIMTGHGCKETVIEALQGHADDYIEKPVDIPKMKESVDKLMKKKYLEDDLDIGGLDGKIAKIKRFTEKNVLKKINLLDVSRLVCLSPKYLSRVFKEKSGQSYSDFKLENKINKAKELLEETGYNIKQISDKLGYENAESFIRQFRKRLRLTPTQYRKKALRKNSARRKKLLKK